MTGRLLALFLALLSGCQTGGGQGVCDDVAVVGAGPGGTYAAYRLRNQGLSVSVYEYSNRVGGRLFTRHLPGAEDVNAEMGGMAYNPDLHPTFARLIQELRIPLSPNDTELVPRYWLRHKSLTFGTDPADFPYNLTSEERTHANDLLMYYVKQLVGDNVTVTKDNAVDLKTADGSKFLYQLSVTEGMRQAGASEEGIRFLTAKSGFRSMFEEDVSMANTLLLTMEEGKLDKTFTPRDGMDALPKTLLKTFLKASPSHRFVPNRRLVGLQTAPDGSFLLNLEVTQSVESATISQGVTKRACAKKVILALPRLALEQLLWQPLQENSTLRRLLQAVGDKPAFKIQAAYAQAWWRPSKDNVLTMVLSDTALGQTVDFGDSVRGSSVLMASYVDGHFVGQWRELQGQGQWLQFSPPGPDGMTSAMLGRLHSLLAQEFGLNVTDIPTPVSAACRLWDAYPYGAGWTHWKTGFRWDTVWKTLRQPVRNQGVYIVGSSFATPDLTTWSEGALETVDDVMKNYFGI